MLFSNRQLWVWLWLAVTVNSFTLDNGNMKKLEGGREVECVLDFSKDKVHNNRFFRIY